MSHFRNVIHHVVMAFRPRVCNHAEMVSEEKQFHGWRLLGVIIGVAVVLAIISFVVDWMVIGPLEGRVF